MVNVPVITRRELSSYFLSPIAYVVLAAFAVAQGIAFALLLGRGGIPDLDLTAQAVFRVPFDLLMLTVPIITMRLLSEESRSGTLETLMTTSTTETEVALGKFAGALVFASVMFLPLAAQVVYLEALGTLDPGAVMAGTLGLLLLTGQFVAIGLFCSAMTRVQVAAAIISMAALVALYSLQFLAAIAPAPLQRTVAYLSPAGHYLNFVKGVVDTRDLAYFALSTGAFLFLTIKALQARRVGGGARRAFGAEGLGFAATVVLALTLASLLGYISTRRSMRMDWTRKDSSGLGRHELHAATGELLGTLDRNVTATVLYRFTGLPAEDRYIATWRDATRGLLTEFMAHSPHVSVRYVDAGRNPERRARLAERIGEPNLAEFCVVFESGETHAVVSLQDAIAPAAEGRWVFAGEAAYARAIERLCKPQESVVYMVTGLGLEPPPGGAPPQGGSLSAVVAMLRRDDYDVRPLALGDAVPEDCAVLIVAGPDEALSPAQAGAIRAYLDRRDGGAVVALDPRSPGTERGSLEVMLEGYGISARTDAVTVAPRLNQYARLIGYKDELSLRLPTGMAGHPVTAGLGVAPLTFRRACPLLLGAEGAEQVIAPRALLVVAAMSWGETDYDPRGGRACRFDADRDVPAPIVVGALAELPAEQDLAASRGPRLAVFGSATSFCDDYVQDHPDNLQLLRNCVNWMARDTQMPHVAPRVLKSQSVALDPGSLNAARYGFIAGLPACVVALGLVMWFLRRR